MFGVAATVGSVPPVMTTGADAIVVRQRSISGIAWIEFQSGVNVYSSVVQFHLPIEDPPSEEKNVDDLHEASVRLSESFD